MVKFYFTKCFSNKTLYLQLKKSYKSFHNKTKTATFSTSGKLEWAHSGLKHKCCNWYLVDPKILSPKVLPWADQSSTKAKQNLKEVIFASFLALSNFRRNLLLPKLRWKQQIPNYQNLNLCRCQMQWSPTTKKPALYATSVKPVWNRPPPQYSLHHLQNSWRNTCQVWLRTTRWKSYQTSRWKSFYTPRWKSCIIVLVVVMAPTRSALIIVTVSHKKGATLTYIICIICVTLNKWNEYQWLQYVWTFPKYV